MSGKALFDFSGRVALVTGGSRGIGYDICLNLARCGAQVYFCGTNSENGAEAATRISDQSGSQQVFFRQANVADFQESTALVESIVKEAGQLDFLVNNAGITRDNLILRLKECDWDEVMAVNLKGSFNCSKAAAKAMLKKRFGRMIFLSSVVGLMGNPGQANYAATKAGVIGLARSLARELASRDITSNVVAPGYIETEMTEAMESKAQDKIREAIPLNRLGRPSDISNTVLFLLSPLANYITGQVLQVDGGLLIA